jgi:hypothetical protein
MEKLGSCCGRLFNSAYCTNLLQKYGIGRSLSSAFYAQPDGLKERLIQLNLTKLKLLSITKIRITKDILGIATAAINSIVSFVRKVTLSSILTKFIDISVTENELKSFLDNTKKENQLSQINTKKRLDRGRRQREMLQPGALLWLTTKHTKPNGPQKLESRYEGPYRLIKHITPEKVKLELNDK